jgi:uncharacterized protein YlzI (FlbEa/FlbD family)
MGYPAKNLHREAPMPKLCKFTSPGDGKPVYVNPAQVSVVYTYKGEPPDTIIAFRKDFLLGVKESLEEVVAMLEEVAGEPAAE